MFGTVLVANRGEIAVRVMDTLRRMGIRSVAVFSDADAEAPHVHAADVAVHIGPTPAAESYLNIPRIIAAAQATGAQAIHPGYGFLSENVDFARACEHAGITFIGPPVAAIEAMGDKIRAKVTAIAADVPVVPGRHDPDMSDEDIAEAVQHIGFPVLLKPSAGGGGKGMRVVRSEADLTEALTSARREARNSFGDDTLLVERYVDQPRHIEVQVLADAHGHVIHLGERECSLQRRHQKVIEEAPSPLLDAATRAAICESAVRLAAAVGYVGAGTVEYVVPARDPSAFAFLEMNTRLQVEHPVTELVTGVDLVEWQVRIANGERLSLQQSDVVASGHAMEARVYAEDATRGFLPTGGHVLLWTPPGGVRVDTGIATGSDIGSAYDPMLAKVIAHAPDRAEAIQRLDAALAHTITLGVVTNADYLRHLLADGRVRAGDIDTGLIDRLGPPESGGVAIVHAVAAAVRYALDLRAAAGAGPWEARDGWRLGCAAPTRIWVHADHDAQRVEVRGDLPHLVVAIDGVEHRVSVAERGAALDLTVDDVARRVTCAVAADGRVWVHEPDAGTRALRVITPIERRLRGPATADGHGAGPWSARSPMPGTVVAVAVQVGQAVQAGDSLITVEAMKMEHTLRAPAPGVVAEVRGTHGAQVRLDEELVVVDLAAVEGDDLP